VCVCLSWFLSYLEIQLASIKHNISIVIWAFEKLFYPVVLSELQIAYLRSVFCLQIEYKLSPEPTRGWACCCISRWRCSWIARVSTGIVHCQAKRSERLYQNSFETRVSLHIYTWTYIGRYVVAYSSPTFNIDKRTTSNRCRLVSSMCMIIRSLDIFSSTMLFIRACAAYESIHFNIFYPKRLHERQKTFK